MFEISPTEWTAIQLSLRVAAVATLVATPLGIAVAWLLARRDFWGKSVVDALIHLPLVLPPVATGYLLLLTFGRRNLEHQVEGLTRNLKPYFSRMVFAAVEHRKAI